MFALFNPAILRLLHMILGVSTVPQNFPPPLPHAEEEMLFVKFREGREDASEARQKLILHNLRLVSHIVRKYYATGKDQEDLVSIGTIGLVKAVDSFKSEAGTRFATYAARCIQNEILMHFRAEKKHTSEVSMNDTIDVDRDGNPLTYMDVISSDECVSDEVFRSVEAEQAMKYVRTKLEPRERQVIVMRFGLDGRPPLTQRDVAVKLGISRSYVSRIEKAAIDKLREAFGS
ncbi:MAG: sigma-70 family RNA polymerase sigma factor [Ruminococcaceae bacterium]|nr:sigma-70 family RNA polymerase sigma factor [Oscillospiraceae bacterium]